MDKNLYLERCLKIWLFLFLPAWKKKYIFNMKELKHIKYKLENQKNCKLVTRFKNIFYFSVSLNSEPLKGNGSTNWLFKIFQLDLQKSHIIRINKGYLFHNWNCIYLQWPDTKFCWKSFICWAFLFYIIVS